MDDITSPVGSSNEPATVPAESVQGTEDASKSAELAEPSARKRPRESAPTPVPLRSGGLSGAPAGLGGSSGGGGGDRSRSIHIAGIPPQATDAIIYELAVQCGPVTRVWLPPLPEHSVNDSLGEAPAVDGEKAPSDAAASSSSDTKQPTQPPSQPQPLRFGFIEYQHGISVQYACRVLDGVALYGARLKVSPSGGREARDALGDDKTDVFVRPLDERVDRWDLWDLGSVAGPLADVTLPTDAQSGRKRGFGFLVYPTRGDALRAIRVLDGLSLAGRQLQLKISDSSSNRGSLGGAGARLAPHPEDFASGTGDGSADSEPLFMIVPPATEDVDSGSGASSSASAGDGPSCSSSSAPPAPGVPVTEDLLIALRREAATRVGTKINRDLQIDGAGAPPRETPTDALVRKVHADLKAHLGLDAAREAHQHQHAGPISGGGQGYGAPQAAAAGQSSGARSSRFTSTGAPSSSSSSSSAPAPYGGTGSGAVIYGGMPQAVHSSGGDFFGGAIWPSGSYAANQQQPVTSPGGAGGGGWGGGAYPTMPRPPPVVSPSHAGGGPGSAPFNPHQHQQHYGYPQAPPQQYQGYYGNV